MMCCMRSRTYDTIRYDTAHVTAHDNGVALFLLIIIIVLKITCNRMSFYIWNCGACLYIAVTTKTTAIVAPPNCVKEKTNGKKSTNYSIYFSGGGGDGGNLLLSKLNVLGTTVFLGVTNGGFASGVSSLDLDPNSEIGRENMGLLVVMLWWSLLTIFHPPPVLRQLWRALPVFAFATVMCLATGLVSLLLVNKEELVEHCSGMGPLQ
jgi:hypothetical protein